MSGGVRRARAVINNKHRWASTRPAKVFQQYDCGLQKKKKHCPRQDWECRWMLVMLRRRDRLVIILSIDGGSKSERLKVYCTAYHTIDSSLGFYKLRGLSDAFVTSVTANLEILG